MKKSSFVNSLLIGAVLSFGLVDTGLAQSVREPMDEIALLREDMKVLQRQVYRTNNDMSPTSAADVAVKMGEFDEQLRQTIGRIDELEFKIKSLEDKINIINKDVDVRIKMIEGKPINNTDTAPVSSAAKNTFKAPVAVAAPKSVTGDAVDAGDDLKPVKTQSVEQMYQAGLDAVKASDYATAESKFNSILKRYPDDKLAGNAQYWVGEVYYAKKDWQRAAIAFASGLEKYKSGPKGADSLLKLGLSMRELGKKEEACQSFKSLKTEFPKAEKSIIDRAADEAKKLGCK